MKAPDPPPLHSLPLDYFLARHSRSRPQAVAIVDGSTAEAVTYRELDDRVTRIAAALARRGIAPGERVACLATNSMSALEMYLALARSGLVAVPLNVRLSAQELSFILADSQARAIFASESLRALAESAAAGTPAAALRIIDGGAQEGWIAFGELLSEQGPARADAPISGDSLGMLLYTSGTTGRPKGCMILQRCWAGYAAHMAAGLRMGADDVYLAFLPFFHVAGFGTAVSQLILGGTVVTAAASRPEFLCELVARYRVSIVFLVPGVSGAFLAQAEPRRSDLASLRTFISGAGLESPGLPERVERALGAKYFGIYGQTESGSKISVATAEMIRADAGSYGVVLPFFDYRLLDEAGREVAPGEVGELCLRGATVMAGYWNDPQASAEACRHGWHHTGDLFVLMDGGQIKMVDRKKYLIKSGGENVYPQEVELVLLSHPAVADAAVIGVADPHWGEVVKACIVLRPGMTIERRALAEYVGSRIAGYKKPRFVAFVDVIPRNVSGKILKSELASCPTTPEQRV